MIYRCTAARRTTADPCDAWLDMLRAVFLRAIRDAQRKYRPSLDARLFLFEPAPGELMRAVDLDPAAVRAAAVAEWVRRAEIR